MLVPHIRKTSSPILVHGNGWLLPSHLKGIRYRKHSLPRIIYQRSKTRTDSNNSLEHVEKLIEDSLFRRKKSKKKDPTSPNELQNTNAPELQDYGDVPQIDPIDRSTEGLTVLKHVDRARTKSEINMTRMAEFRIRK